jgi:hypothetical protein
MAAAGARAGETAVPATGAEPRTTTGAGSPASGGAKYTIKRLGARPARSSPRLVAIAAAVALLASGGVAIASFSHPGGHAGRPVPPVTPARSSAVPAPSAPSAPARRAPSIPARRSPAAPPTAPVRGPAAVSMKVIGVGCPSDGDDSVTFDNAPTGPGWTPAGGGWTGNGCDGSTLWTMDPNGNQPVPSTLTWRFSAAGAARCTLAVFVPTLNALGISDYSVSAGPPEASQVVAAVPVRQSAAAGQWLTLGTFPVSGSSLEITTAPMPGTPGPGHHGAIAASAARAVCTS